MDRKVHDTLLKWKSSSGRALVLEGPRQTGKTFIMKEFSKSYHYSVYIDLEENEELKTVFEQTNDASEIYEKLSYNGIRFDTSSGDPLLRQT
ncbi:AAA family ATPase [Methanomethylophilus alvi]|uniref:AAA family ATPase n=1 Tax=Methanomethylophilus alvi TaxID=1291540 RepID=UPI0037DBFF31